MEITMKKILLIFVLLLNITCIAQEDKTVTLTVSGTGKTIEEAKTNALRSAIEQAFGAFISSKTDILNDDLIKDEIVSVANGNIQKFEILSQVEIPNNGYAMTLNATVSISKLTSFAESKGVSIEVKGGLFAANIIQQELNEKAELISLENILNTSNQLLKKSFDYSIETNGNPTVNNENYDIPLKVNVILNKNFYQFRKYFVNSLSSLSMSEADITNYETLKKPIAQLILRRDTISQVDINKKLIDIDYKNKISRILNLEEFDENTEIIKYFYNGGVVEIDSKNKIEELGKNRILKDIEPSLTITKRNDLGYSKIFFRNESSIFLLEKFLETINSAIVNFEISNNTDTNIDKKKLKIVSFDNDFKVILTALLKPGSYEVKLKTTFESSTNNYLMFNDYNRFPPYQMIVLNKFFESTSTGKIVEYFPNLISIFPLKKIDKTMLLSFSKFNENNVITTFDYVDTKSLEEIKQLSEYKIKPKE